LVTDQPEVNNGCQLPVSGYRLGWTSSKDLSQMRGLTQIFRQLATGNWQPAPYLTSDFAQSTKRVKRLLSITDAQFLTLW